MFHFIREKLFEVNGFLGSLILADEDVDFL
jgi:hypothetical protein